MEMKDGRWKSREGEGRRKKREGRGETDEGK